MIFVKLMELWLRTGRAFGYAQYVMDRFFYLWPARLLERRLFKSVVLRCDLRDHIQRRIYFFGAYEPIESHLVLKLVEADDVAIDAGANIGFYSLLLAQKISSGKIYAFEPVQKNFQKLGENIARNNLGSVIVPVAKGLWDKDEVLKFSLADERGDNAGTFSAGVANPTGEVFECPVTSLDQFVAQHNISKVNFIKMDIEGAELFALKGARKTIERHRPAFLIEVNRVGCENFNYSTSALSDFLKEFGYKFYAVNRQAEHSRQAIESFSDIQQANILALPETQVNKIRWEWDSKQVIRSFMNV